MHTKKEVFERLVAPLHLQLALSAKFYQQYLEHRNFQNAELLYASNKKIVGIVKENSGLMPSEIEDDIGELISHYEYWFTQYRKHIKKVKPGPADRFVFNSTGAHIPFPVDAEQRINLFYSDLKKQLTAEMLIQG